MKLLLVSVIGTLLGAAFILTNLHSIHPHMGYGKCLKCEKTWDVVVAHKTFDTEASGCFPLCETCWKELETPDARLPYYWTLVNQWVQWSEDHKKEYPKETARAIHRWETISKAVMEGK